MPRAILLPLSCLVACTYPSFTATKTVELDVPAATVQRLRCTSHNGAIVIRRGAADDSVHLRVRMEAPGVTQAEADDNLNLLSVVHAVDGDLLDVHGEYPQNAFTMRTPGFEFTLDVPERIAALLETHNGDIRVDGIVGAVEATTHNGGISGELRGAHVVAATHNGGIDATLGDAVADGSLTTHNGTVSVTLAANASTWIEANTHNGTIRLPAGATEATVSEDHARCRIGDGRGKLVVETHNGNVVVR